MASAGLEAKQFCAYHRFTASASIRFRGIASAAAAGAPVAPNLSGCWTATGSLSRQPPGPFRLLTRGDAQGGFSAWSGDGSAAQSGSVDTVQAGFAKAKVMAEAELAKWNQLKTTNLPALKATLAVLS